MSETLTTGRCNCGEVSYTISGEPLRMAQCHCKGCQRASGTGHASLAFFLDEQVEVKGGTASYGVEADSGNMNTRYFCPKCGAWMFGSNSARAGMRSVTAGSADDNTWFTPQVVVYCDDRPTWDLTSTEVPNFDTMPPAPPAK